MRVALRDLAPGELDHDLVWGSLAAVLAGGALVAARLPGAGIACPVHALTGWPCLTCGTTRAAFALARGDVGAALAVNPLATVAGIAATLWAAWALASVALRLPRLRVATTRRWEPRALRLGAVALLLGNWAWLVANGT